MSRDYKLRFISLFEQDVAEVIDYIAYRLKNPQAALRLVEAVDQAIENRRPFAKSFAPLPLSRNRKHPYYTIEVGNYTIFYVIIDDVMEVRRFRYSRQDRTRLLPDD
jgi:hypothetical protein